uniref:ANK_REP_REGION domain-containing protein n=1 Tax=Caenorhabditis japonica TaxID=281687 RepID=A0A8R1DJJ4_CAEJA
MQLCLFLALIALGGVLCNVKEDEEVKLYFPNLYKRFSEIALFSRITSLLKLERDLSQDDVRAASLSELLGIDSPDVFTKLDSLNFNSTKENIASWGRLSSAFGESPLVSDWQTINSLETLNDMFSAYHLLNSDAVTIKAGIKKYSDEMAAHFSENSTQLDMIMATPILVFKDALNFLLNAKELGTVDEKFKAKQTILLMKSYTSEFTKLVHNFTADKNFIEIDSFKNLSTSLKPLTETRKVLKRYRASWMHTLSNDITILTEDLKLFETFKEDRTRYEELVVMLGNIEAVVKQLMTPLKNIRVAAGLLSGFTDLSTLINQTLKSDWVKEELTKNNQSHLDILLDQLKPLQAFAERISKVKEVHRKLLDLLSEVRGVFDFSRLANMFNSTLKLFDDIPPLSSLSATAECLKDVPIPSQEVNVSTRIDKVWRVTETIKRAIVKTKQLTAELIELPAIKDLNCVSKIEELTEEFLNSASRANKETRDDVVWNTVHRIQKITGIREYFESLQVPVTKIGEMPSSVIRDLVKGRWKGVYDDSTLYDDWKSYFKDMQMLRVLECIKGNSVINLHLSLKEVSAIVEIGKGLRLIAAHRNVTDSVIPKILDTMVELKEAVKSLSSPSIWNRNAKPTIELPADSVSSLAQGAELFGKLMEIAAKRKELMRINEFDAKVNNAISIIRMPPMHSLWTNSMRAYIYQMLQHIYHWDESAATFTMRNESFLAISTLFEQAANFVGVPNLDSSLFAVPMATTLRASKASDMQAAGNVLHSLRNLQLHYSPKQFLKAEVAARALRDYFDQLFPKAPTMEEMAVVAKSTPIPYTESSSIPMFIFLGAGLVLVFLRVVMFIYRVFWKAPHAIEKLKGRWRHLRFLDEGALLTYRGNKCTPMHLAIAELRIEEVVERIENGAYVNVHSIGKTRETPLHTAVTLDLPEVVTLLLESGADSNAKDHNNETPKDRMTRNMPEINAIFKSFRYKTYLKVWPKELPAEKYRVYIEPKLRKTLKVAPSLRGNMVENFEEATHFVVKTKADEILDLDLMMEENGVDAVAGLMVQVFSPRLVMTSTWLEAGAVRRKDFQNDYKFRLKQVNFQGEEYKTLYKIHEKIHKMAIPYLCNATVFFYQPIFLTRDWKHLHTVVTELGATVSEEFPIVDESYRRKEQALYYRIDVCNTLIIYMKDDEDELNLKHGPMSRREAYAFMEHDDFIAFLLSHKTVDHKDESGRIN